MQLDKKEQKHLQPQLEQTAEMYIIPSSTGKQNGWTAKTLIQVN